MSPTSYQAAPPRIPILANVLERLQVFERDSSGTAPGAGPYFCFANSGTLVFTLSTLGMATLTTYEFRGLRLQKFW